MGRGDLVDVGIRNGVITDIQENLAERGEKELEVEGRVLIPGFVDAHMHLDKAWMGDKEKWDCVTLDDMVMGTVEYVKKHGWTKEEILPRARQAVELGVRKGTTAMRTHVDLNRYRGIAGIRAILELRDQVKPWVDIQIVAFSTDGYSGIADGGEALLREAMKLGADVVGGAPRIDQDPGPYLDMLFSVAKDYNAEIDLHIDESNDPNEIWIELFAEKAVEHAWEGKVTGSHVCSLYWVTEEVADRIIKKMVKAKMHVITNPLTNLYIRGPNPQVSTGPTRIKDLLDAGIHMAAGTDNTRDFFAPLGNADMLLTSLLLAYQRRITEPRKAVRRIW
jgi:cytosine deaminase